MTEGGPPLLEVGWAGRALGEPGHGLESGDLHAVVPFDGGSLVAVIDGLGHGTEAAGAARAAAQVLESYPGASVLALLDHCHEALRKTRGVVMSLCRFDAADALVTWSGVGNVEGELLRADRSAPRRREVIMARGGVVGYRLPPLRETTAHVHRGDILILVTDGIRSNFGADLPLERSPQELADTILARHGKDSDDALALVARYLGAMAPPAR